MQQELLYVILICFAIIIVILLWAYSEKKTLTRDIQERDEEIYQLSKYRTCVDAEATASKIIRDSERKLKEAESNAEKIVSDANIEALDIISKAKSEASSIRSNAKYKEQKHQEKCQAELSNALNKANDIVSEAERKAKDIMGEAYELSKDVKFYEEALASIKNIINGYGFKYLKPLDSVLDELSETFAYTNAGHELQLARDVTRQMANKGIAAECDYVEDARRRTAVAFVLDAFNGKVDSILSMVKQDNYGTLEQKIKDAYSTVNLLGKPFRNARITPEYLNARLQELKSAVAVMAIKQREREEQRVIKERIREEERARREYERAIRDAEKQEAAIRKAIEKATQQMEKAKEEQKAEYEKQLESLQAQLAEAEAKNQRALSMAQQTRSGHVYVISNIGSFGENVYKIGMTRRLEPLDRVRELSDASVPFPFDVHAMIYSDDAPALETELHKLFATNQVNKVNPRKEFFKIQLSNLQEYLKGKNIEVQWTLKAAAAQYYETLALEKAFEENKQLENQWISQQDNNFDSFEDQDEEEADE